MSIKITHGMWLIFWLQLIKEIKIKVNYVYVSGNSCNLPYCKILYTTSSCIIFLIVQQVRHISRYYFTNPYFNKTHTHDN